MRACPLTSRAPMAVRIAKFAESDDNITRRRGRRSATTPPIKSVEIWASVQQAKAIPTSVADPVRSRTANATAIGARFVPKNEIVRAPASRRKLRTRKGLSSRGTALLPVAVQSGIGLPERHCALIRLHVASGCSHVTANRLAELLFRYTLFDSMRPVSQPLPEVGKVRLRIGGDAEMDECQPARLPPLDLVDRSPPRFEVEVRRRRRRQDRSVGLEADSGCVACIQGAVAGEVTDVVTCVPGRGKALEAEHVRSDDADVLRRDRGELSPERVKRIAVEAARARFESARIDEMGRAYLRDVDL